MAATTMGSAYSPSQTRAFIIVSSILPPLVVVAVALRLWIKSPSRWWWDDLIILVGVVFMVTEIGLYWGFVDPLTSLHNTLLFYTHVVLGQGSIFAARLTIMVSIFRLSHSLPMRRVAGWSIALFLLFYIVSVLQVVWVCKANVFYSPPLRLAVCDFSSQIPILRTILSLISDLLLILLPWLILRDLKTDDALKLRVRLTFCASLITTAATLDAVIFNLFHSAFGTLMSCQLEIWLSLLVANLNIILLRLLNRFNIGGRHTVSSSKTPQEFSELEFRDLGRTEAAAQRSELANWNLSGIPAFTTTVSRDVHGTTDSGEEMQEASTDECPDPTKGSLRDASMRPASAV